MENRISCHDCGSHAVKIVVRCYDEDEDNLYWYRCNSCGIHFVAELRQEGSEYIVYQIEVSGDIQRYIIADMSIDIVEVEKLLLSNEYIATTADLVSVLGYPVSICPPHSPKKRKGIGVGHE